MRHETGWNRRRGWWWWWVFAVSAARFRILAV